MSAAAPTDVIEAALSDADIYERIVEAVMDHRLAPGTRLGEEKLGRAFGVSRTRIRQVLIRLAAEQIVVLNHNRGASIACPTPQEAQEVFGARILIELPILESFIDNASARDLANVARILREEEQARRTQNRRAAIRLSGEFHLAIAAGANNATLEKMLRELVSRTSLILMTYQDTEAGRHEHGCGCDEHESLLEAMQARDVKTARRLMKRHLEHLQSQLSFEPDSSDSPNIENLFRPA
ncbi:GntR family transcriptional regulator [Viridibacterium curvum]|uniref:GntR family transcriptional regulator n=1 Tax=Viridibacterium curvum TaxID=1101404 RepID=A0ABP9QQ16_9RHOO